MTGGRYDQAKIISGDQRLDVQCLGVVPVLVGSANSMFFRGLISSDISVLSSGFEATPGISAFQPVVDMQASRVEAPLSAYSPALMQFGEGNFALSLSSRTVYSDSLGRRAVEQFPAIVQIQPGSVEQRNLRSVCLAVFVAYRDQANEDKINFKLVEAFSGQLDHLATNPDTGSSDYICDKVNGNSRYVNMFSTVRPGVYGPAKTSLVSRQTVRSLGFYREETYKHIDYVGSIVEPLTRILDRLQDPNQIQLDVMADAGITNIAQFVKDYGDDKATDPEEKHQYNADMYPYFEMKDGFRAPWDSDDTAAWYSIMRKMDDFCKNVRKDCVFVADGFRPFVLAGNEKLSRPTNTGICQLGGAMPKLLQNIRKMPVLDSSYSAGYSNWFYCPDYRTGDFFWCPPSIKAAGVYTYNDAYGHVWSAPAGLNRGTVSHAVDVAFNPYRDEAGQIYKQAWNYAVAYPLEGVVLEG